MSIIKLDYDNTKKLKRAFGRLDYIMSVIECKVMIERYHVSPSGKGLHIHLYMDKFISDAEIIFIQTLLGSDWKREIKNFRRLKREEKGWNVTFK